jgi:hypothetical protein
VGEAGVLTDGHDLSFKQGDICSERSRGYSITSSARVRNDSARFNPSVVAVWRFTISSNLVGS